MLFLPLLKAQEIIKNPDKPSSGELANEENKEEAAREKNEISADRDVVLAAKAFEENRYEEAVSLYLSAKGKLEKTSNLSSYIDAKIKNINQNIAVVYHYWARSIAEQAEKEVNEKSFNKAIKNCAEAVKMDPTLSKKIERLLKRIEKQKKVTKYRSVTDEAVVDGNKKDRLYQIDILMAQGRKLYAQKLWHRAREKFEEVLILDPYNITAVEKIKKLTKKMYKAGVERYETTRQERYAETEWKQTTPLIPRSLEPESQAPTPILRNVAGTQIQKKLDEIMIEHMEFEDASIRAVINMLRIEAKKQDKDKEGVNIILRMAAASNGSGSGDAGDSVDGGGDDEEEFLLDEDDAELGDSDTVADDSSGSGEKTITIMFDDLSLGEAIRNICLAAELKYRVEEYAVVIAGKDVPLDDLETRIYPIDSEAGMSSEEDSAGDGGGTGAASVQGFFERQGILFPEGAKAVYDEAISRLIATNTPEQLRRIERIIDELNVVDPQVLIECKFVEFHENKQDEFGIAWTVGRPVGTSAKSVTWNRNDQPLRFLGANSGANGDTAFEISRTSKDGVTYAAEIHALNLQGDTNVLSCPRITTQNGEEATIRMVTEVYFPDSWGEPTLIDNGAQAAIDSEVGYVASMPEFSEPTELGVRLTVTPNVDPDKYTITLDMIPVVQSQIDWTDYSYVQNTSGGTVKNTVRMVIIEARTVTTQVTIYDGETIVMGGIMRDTIINNDDRWPIIGDMPLIGRFFRSTSETSVKENLLIFTTPRLVNPNGSPLRQREVRGMPPFRM
jgi:tetratricopeptide (TPR) repeat protein